MKKLLLITFGIFIGFTSKAQTELWGITKFGGQNSTGVIFKTDGSGSNQTVQYNFGSEGDLPKDNLIQASDGKLYGMTGRGGANDLGVLFQYDPTTSTYIKKLDFDGNTGTKNGSYPYGSLLVAADGKLYGKTYMGGINNSGVLFQYDPVTSTYTKKIDFSGARYTFGSLIQASDGKLYGMISGGGANNGGALYQYDIATSTYTKKHDFDNINGDTPVGSLTQASDGKLYGMTSLGGVADSGVLFQYDLATSTYTKKIDFATRSNGCFPQGSLIQASDGKLYGMTSLGGINDLGVLFQYDPATSAYIKKLDFAGTINGSMPKGSLMQASDGKLYGLTENGGVNDFGVLFQYDPATSVYTKTLDFNGTNGSNPSFSNLIEITVNSAGIQQLATDNQQQLIYPNPTSGNFTVNTSIVVDKIVVGNIIGETLVEMKPKGLTTQLTLENFDAGIYFVKIISNSQTKTVRLIKK